MKTCTDTGRAQRGSMLLVYAIVAIAAVGMIWGAISWHAGVHYKRGLADKQVEWDRANVRAAAAQRARELDVSEAIKEKEAQRMAANDKAADYETRWKEAVRENRRKGVPLATCDQAPAPGAPTAVAGAPAGGVRFTWEFVRQYDSAWTGRAGEPLYPAPVGPEAAEGSGAASPYGPADVLDVHGDNAAGASECRREYRSLVEKIKAAEKAWGKAGP